MHMCRGSKLLHTAKILIISVLAPLLYYGFVGQITEVFEDQQTAHQADRLAGTTIVLTIQREESVIKFLPIYLVCQLVQWVRLVQHIR